MTYGFVLKILANPEKYTSAQVEKATRLKQKYGQLDICSKCGEAASYVLIQKLGMCGNCNSWKRYCEQLEYAQQKTNTEQKSKKQEEGFWSKFWKSF